MKRHNRNISMLVHFIMILVVIVALFPVLWSCVISIKSVGEKISGFSALSISNPTLANYKRLFQLIPMKEQLFNSVFTTLVGTATTMFFCPLAGFAFAKYRFPVLFCGGDYHDPGRSCVCSAVYDHEEDRPDQQPLVADPAQADNRCRCFLFAAVYYGCSG